MAFPKVQHCIVCEDIRREVGRKQTLLGFFGITPNVTILLASFDNPIERLSFLFIADGGEGIFQLGCEIIDASGRGILNLPEKEVVFAAGAKRFSLVFAIQSPRFLGPGRHQLKLIADGNTVYETSFDVQKGEPKDFE